ncbi:Cyclic phosphodiesterase [Mycena chlorophos]|uniref:Cyclic phosphodiesterase n=1 Tax=Mycena chlorophos TaxID=658473 RepID=A0A8H6TR42_MYCCL|nr:Cyclic phosphodiesterase [Mycena chlorophos]
MAVRPEPPNVVGSSTSYPAFYPHITLASLPSDPEPTLQQIHAAIPPLSQPLDVSFHQVEVGDHYFRSVYIAIQPTADLLALHQHVHHELGIANPRTPKFPHLSLAYITDEDAAAGERARYYDALAKNSKIVSTGDGVSLNCGLNGQDEWLQVLKSLEIWVTRCEGPVETWTVESKIPLKVRT